MAFSQEVRDQAWRCAGGKCECLRLMCPHHSAGRCNAPLRAHHWHAHHVTAVQSGGTDVLSNCEALCIPCHHSTRTYGG